MDNKQQWGLTPYGFRRKTFSECLSDRIERAKEMYGPSVDTSETSFLGTYIRNTAWDEAVLWEKMEEVYLSAFISSSEGASLDNVAEQQSISRRPATPSYGIAYFEGENHTPIPKGFKVQTEDGIIFETLNSEVIRDGVAEVPIRSVALGKHTNVDAGAINSVVHPQRGIDSVRGTRTTGGLDVETDEEFRERFRLSHSRGGGSTIDAIRAALLDLEEVMDADVQENTTMEYIGKIPPKSVFCIVSGGDDQEIAETIFKSKAGGIQAYGSTVVKVEDSKGRVHDIGFSRAKERYVYVKIILVPGEEYKGDEVVKRAVVNYIGGVDDDGIQYTGLKMGASVINARVMSSILCLGGVEDIKVLLSLDGKNYTEGNLEIGEEEVAVVRWEDMVIEYEV